MIAHALNLAALRARALTCAVLPADQAWENVSFTPTPGREYIEEEYVPATQQLLTTTAQGGTVVETGLYVIRWYALADTGYSGNAAKVDALLARFTPGTVLALSDGTHTYVRSDVAPFRGQFQNLKNGWSVCTVTIPWTAWTTNAVAA